jgi:hypothetical protein
VCADELTNEGTPEQPGMSRAGLPISPWRDVRTFSPVTRTLSAAPTGERRWPWLGPWTIDAHYAAAPMNSDEAA